ncbi:MAG: hypothetical protein ACYC27_02895 [Armatimonadota bacterium]
MFGWIKNLFVKNTNQPMSNTKKLLTFSEANILDSLSIVHNDPNYLKQYDWRLGDAFKTINKMITSGILAPAAPTDILESQYSMQELKELVATHNVKPERKNSKAALASAIMSQVDAVTIDEIINNNNYYILSEVGKQLVLESKSYYNRREIQCKETIKQYVSNREYESAHATLIEYRKELGFDISRYPDRNTYTVKAKWARDHAFKSYGISGDLLEEIRIILAMVMLEDEYLFGSDSVVSDHLKEKITIPPKIKSYVVKECSDEIKDSKKDALDDGDAFDEEAYIYDLCIDEIVYRESEKASDKVVD